jgi:hypothetical protein
VSGEAARFADAIRHAFVLDVRVEGSAISVAAGGGRGTETVDTPGIVRLLVAHGAAVESVVPETPSLEDVYLRLLGTGEGTSVVSSA